MLTLQFETKVTKQVFKIRLKKVKLLIRTLHWCSILLINTFIHWVKQLRCLEKFTIM